MDSNFLYLQDDSIVALQALVGHKIMLTEGRPMGTNRSTSVPLSQATLSGVASCPADEHFPLPKMLVLSLQHLCVMISGTVAVPFIIGSALGLSPQEIAML